MLKRNSLRHFHRSVASQKVLSFIPPDKYLEECKLKAKLSNKLVVMNSLKGICSTSRTNLATAEKTMRRMASGRIYNNKPLSSDAQRNFQVMLTGRNVKCNYDKVKSSMGCRF